MISKRHIYKDWYCRLYTIWNIVGGCIITHTFHFYLMSESIC